MVSFCMHCCGIISSLKHYRVWILKNKTYVMCVTNNVIEVTQYTIAWYVYDNNLLHKNPEVISDIMDGVKKKIVEIYVGRGNKHTFLGMKNR